MRGTMYAISNKGCHGSCSAAKAGVRTDEWKHDRYLNYDLKTKKERSGVELHFNLGKVQI